MASLQEIAEEVFLQINPKPSDETATTREEVIASARAIVAPLYWRMAREEKTFEGYYNVPSFLITSVEKEVVNNRIDISDLKPLRALPNDSWLMPIGGLTCDCEYIKSNPNTSKLVCYDDAFDGYKTFVVMDKSIVFPRGAHKSPLEILYAIDGTQLDGSIIIDEVVGGQLREKLLELYLGKVAKEDTSNNTNSNN